MVLTRQQLLRDLYVAYYDARRHKGKMSYILKWEVNLRENMEQLCDDLMNRNYVALPSKCFIVEYPKKREVFAAQFRDRIVHHLYYNYTLELYARTFIQDSYSCLPGRGTHYGIKRLTDYCRRESLNWQEKCYVMKIDIRGYFMHIVRSRLLEIAISTLKKMASHRISKDSKETWADRLDMDLIYWLTKEIIMLNPKKSSIMVGSEENWNGLDAAKSLMKTADGLGLPIGNLTSQLFSNVYLNELDQYMKRVIGCRRYGRYVDDAYIVSSDKEWLLSIVPKIHDFLLENLGLEMHMGKLTMNEIHQGVEFLGAFIKPYRTYTSNNTLKRIRMKLSHADPTDRQRMVNSVNSYLGSLSHTSSYKIRRQLFQREKYLRVGVFDSEMTKIKDRYVFYNLI